MTDININITRRALEHAVFAHVGMSFWRRLYSTRRGGAVVQTHPEAEAHVRAVKAHARGGEIKARPQTSLARTP